MSPTPATSESAGQTYAQLEDAALETIVRWALLAPIIQIFAWAAVALTIWWNLP